MSLKLYASIFTLSNLINHKSKDNDIRKIRNKMFNWFTETESTCIKTGTHIETHTEIKQNNIFLPDTCPEEPDLVAVPVVFLLTLDNERQQDIEEQVERQASQCICSFSLLGRH